MFISSTNSLIQQAKWPVNICIYPHSEDQQYMTKTLGDFGNRHSTTPPGKDFWCKPRKPPEMSSLISTCSQRMGTWGHTAVLLQRTAVPLQLHLWLKEIHFWWEEPPGTTSSKHGDRNRCVIQALWQTESAIKSPPMRLALLTVNGYCEYHQLQQKSDPSLCLWWLFTHQKAGSLRNTRLYAFFSPSWAASWQNHHYFLSKINTALQEFPLMLFQQTSKIRS